jgi:hypothetical protein
LEWEDERNKQKGGAGIERKRAREKERKKFRA